MEKKRMSKSMMNLPMPPKYSLVENAQVKDFVCIKIESGEFQDVTYNYDVVSIGEDGDAETVPLTYNYNIIVGEDKVSAAQKDAFEEITASILHEIITDIHEVEKKNVD